MGRGRLSNEPASGLRRGSASHARRTNLWRHLFVDRSSKETAVTTLSAKDRENASHVRIAIARFNQVKGVSDHERDAAWKRIKAAAKKHGLEVNEKSWREIGND
jgi:ABC-type Fe3+-citrate transport system substrate-binding protein